MRKFEPLDAIRARAREYEEALPPRQRKQLGQYFSGLPLGKLLAHLALDSETRSVLDPMAGHGDLLDAAWEAASERGITLDRLDGIEVDENTALTCRARLAAISHGTPPAQQIIAADAFDPASIRALPLQSYDLVITNPPYVRYQAHNNTGGVKTDGIRSGLISIIQNHFSPTASKTWKELAEAYSGLADLSVPAWLLAAAMVRPGGRLAVVVPATWRSRDYADVIRYLLLRCFSLECIVEDQQPGWFSDALVRTHLIVAGALSEQDKGSTVTARREFPKAKWVQIAPAAAAEASLVGAAFGGCHPEAQFAAWTRNNCQDSRPAITVRDFNLQDEWTALRARIAKRRWHAILEHQVEDLPLFFSSKPSVAVPDIIKAILPDGFSPNALASLEEVGIRVGQGLRTGCNSFFYVTASGDSSDRTTPVEASLLFDRRTFSTPTDALRPVLRRQSELASMERGCLPDGRVLDLRQWVLPEDFDSVCKSEGVYAASGQTLPRIMPEQLAAYVRTAAAVNANGEGDEKRIPDLSAVRTNVRMPRNGHVTPRFWYMLPDFAARHKPAAFVARINHGLPWVEVNFDPPLIIDANFSTFWAPNGNWTRHALKALLNSTWCRVFMETLGTSLGGGALKLEATHFRQMSVPVLNNAQKAELTTFGKELRRDTPEIQSSIDALVLGALSPRASSRIFLDDVARTLAGAARQMSCVRQRTAS